MLPRVGLKLPIDIACGGFEIIGFVACVISVVRPPVLWFFVALLGTRIINHVSSTCKKDAFIHDLLFLPAEHGRHREPAFSAIRWNAL
jgi:hypothetical protein